MCIRDRSSAVFRDPLGDVGCRREIDRGCKHLDHEFSTVLHTLRLRVNDHSFLDSPRARRNEHAGTFNLHHADSARIHRMERLEKTQRWYVETHVATRAEYGRALASRHLLSVDRQRDCARGRPARLVCRVRWPLKLNEWT